MHSKLILLAPFSVLIFCGLQSCQSSDSRDEPRLDQHVDNSMLQHVPEGDRGDVTNARESADTARDAYAAAKVETTRSIDRRKLADKDTDVAQAEMKRAEAAVDLAQNGTTEDLERARQALADSRTVVAAARTRIALRDRQVDYAKSFENLKQKNNDLAQAKVEAVKAQSVSKLDRPQMKSVDVAAFEKQVRENQEQVNIAQVKVDAARKEVETARKLYDTDVKAVPASSSRDWPKEDELSK